MWIYIYNCSYKNRLNKSHATSRGKNVRSKARFVWFFREKKVNRNLWLFINNYSRKSLESYYLHCLYIRQIRCLVLTKLITWCTSVYNIIVVVRITWRHLTWCAKIWLYDMSNNKIVIMVIMWHHVFFSCKNSQNRVTFNSKNDSVIQLLLS